MVTALILLSLLGTFAASLYMRVDLELEAQAGEETWARLRVRWLRGSVGYEFATDAPKKEKVAKEEKPEDPESDPLAPAHNAMSVWESSLRDKIETLLKELYQRVTLQALSVHGRIGLGDPADTGIAMAAILPIADLADQLSMCDVDIEPCYEQAELTGEANANLSLIPAELLPPLLSFGLSRENLREMRALWKNRAR